MGTRGSVGFIYKNEVKLAYNGYDSYPDGLGADILDLIVKINIEDGWDKFISNGEKLKNIEGEVTDNELIERYKKYSNLDVSSKKLSDSYCLFREIQGVDWLEEMYRGDLEHYPLNNKFIKESLFCEYAYIINLDTMKFEFYDGFQQKKQIGNRFGEELCEGYYPCRLVGVFNLTDINSKDKSDDLVERMQKILDDGDGVDDPSVLSYFRKPKLDVINEKSLSQ